MKNKLASRNLFVPRCVNYADNCAFCARIHIIGNVGEIYNPLRILCWTKKKEKKHNFNPVFPKSGRKGTTDAQKLVDAAVRWNDKRKKEKKKKIRLLDLVWKVIRDTMICRPGHNSLFYTSSWQLVQFSFIHLFSQNLNSTNETS